MKRTALIAIAASVLLLSLSATACPFPVKAESTGYIKFVDSGVTIYSPLNTTYNNRNLTLNLTLAMVGMIHSDGGMVTTVSMNYTIDGIYKGQVPLWANAETHVVIGGYGSTNLPELPDGSHSLTIYLYGYNQQSPKPQFKSYVNTVYFSIESSPTPYQEPTQMELIEPILDMAIVVAVIIVAVGAGLLVYFRKRKK
jgi:hypothetical protein